MKDFLLAVVSALVVAGIGFGAAAFTLGRTRGLDDPVPDGVPNDLPQDRPITSDDVRGLRFDTGIRGYRMAQVDHALGRISHDLVQLTEYVRALEEQVAALRGSRGPSGAGPLGGMAADAGVDPVDPTGLGPSGAGDADVPWSMAAQVEHDQR